MSGQRQERPGGAGIDWLPAADIIETSDGFEVALEICGVPRQAIEVSVDDARLTVSGTRTKDNGAEVVHHRERRLGRFGRSFAFRVPVDPHGVQASLANGVLTVRIPKQVPTRVAVE